MVRTKCDQCKEAYSERKPPQEPPCEKCFVELRRENSEAVKIFKKVRRQLILGTGGAIDINHLAVHEAMKLYGVKDKKGCFEKIMILSDWWVDKVNKK